MTCHAWKCPLERADAIDFELGPGATLAQLGNLAEAAVWYSDAYARLRDKHWPSVLAWNLAIGAIATSAREGT